jgi:integrase
MTDDLADQLRAHRKESEFRGRDDLVFGHPGTGEPLAKANITRRFKASLKAAGLDDSHRFHDLRHTFGTGAAAAGVSMRILQEWMGHRDLTRALAGGRYRPRRDIDGTPRRR